MDITKIRKHRRSFEACEAGFRDLGLDKAGVLRAVRGGEQHAEVEELLRTLVTNVNRSERREATRRRRQGKGAS